MHSGKLLLLPLALPLVPVHCVLQEEPGSHLGYPCFRSSHDDTVAHVGLLLNFGNTQ